MIDFCIENERLYEILDIRSQYKVKLFFEPFDRYLFKKKIENFINKYEPKLIIQPNDTNVYNDLIVKIAKKKKIKTLGLQWAVTAQEEFYFKNRFTKNLKNIKGIPLYRIVLNNFLNKFFGILHFPLLHFLGVYSNHKLSLGQGNSDAFGVINKFTKNLLIKQGVNERKLIIIGSLHYDDALKTSRFKSKSDLREKYKIANNDISIVYFSQPFYKKDITILSLNDQLNYLDDLIKNIESFFKEKSKNYKLIIKLHPAESLEDYQIYVKRENVILLEHTDNYELLLLSDLCISQHSTILQAAIVMRKPIISLNILDLEATRILSKVIGIKKTINSWAEFKEALEILEDSNYTSLNNISFDNVIIDERSYYRIKKLIKTLISN
jgi:hypothetical protein